MGLLSTEVEVVLAGNNVKWYENKGYILPRRYDKRGRFCLPKNSKLLVKVEDLGIDSGKIALEGEIINMDSRELKSGKFLVLFDLYDGTSTITCKAFVILLLYNIIFILL